MYIRKSQRDNIYRNERKKVRKARINIHFEQHLNAQCLGYQKNSNTFGILKLIHPETARYCTRRLNEFIRLSIARTYSDLLDNKSDAAGNLHNFDEHP